MPPSIAPGNRGQPGPVTEQTAETYAATFDTKRPGYASAEAWIGVVMLAQGSAAFVTCRLPTAVPALLRSLYAASKHEWKGDKAAALRSGTRIGGTPSTWWRPVQSILGCLNRFAGTADERKAVWAADVPLNRVRRPRRDSPRPVSSGVGQARRSSRVPSYVATEASRPGNVYRGGRRGLAGAA